VVAHETVLATFEPGDPVLLDVRSRAEAEARVRAAGAALEQAKAQGRQTAAELEYAEAEVLRFRRLQQEGIATQEALDAAERNARTTTDGVRAAEFAVEAAAGELAAARAVLLEGGSRPGGEVLALRSPVSGEVLKRFRESEAMVPAGEPLLEVGDPRGLEIVADYLSSDAVAMESGQRVLIEQWGGERPLEGRLRRIEPSGFLKISALGVEEQRVNVLIDLVEPPEVWRRLGDGFRVETRVVIWEADDVLRVPASALFRNGERGQQWAVFTVESPEGGRVSLTPVEIGHRSGLQAEVLGGLQEGQTVVAHPNDAVTDGVEVVGR
jgi:HlyD family secretion protein